MIRVTAFALALCCWLLLGVNGWVVRAEDNPGPTAGPRAPFAGTFKDAELNLKLDHDPTRPGTYYNGTLSLKGKNYRVSAEEKDGKLDGTFADKDGDEFPLAATIADGTLTLTSGGATYHLTSADRPAAENPLAARHPTPPDPPAPAAEAPSSGPPAARPGGIGMMLRVEKERPIIVEQVASGGPADKAGILAGDVIRKIDGEDPHAPGYGEPAAHIRGRIGTEVALTVERDAAIKEFKITRVPLDLPAPPGPRPGPGGQAHKAGIGLQISITGDGSIFVKDTVRSSPAARAGVRKGDQLISIDGTRIRGVDDLAAKLPGEVGSSVKLEVRRNGENKEFDLKRELITIPPPPSDDAGDNH